MLSLVCGHCKSENPPENKFCDECGEDLGAPREAPRLDYDQPQSYTPKFLAEKILNNRSAMEGERKLVTVLFADVAHFTSMSEKLDPEEVHQIMDECFRILMDEIHRYEGTINQFTGDGVMALFGAPVTHEDHAQRACYAALSIQRAIGEYSEKIKREFGVDFRIRIGLNSGHVIVGSIGNDLRMDYTAVGDTTNLAARIQQVTKPGQVWVSEETYHLIRNYFQNELAEETALKGKAQAQRIYHVISERPGVTTRFQAGMVRGVTELVGRRPEMETLMGALKRAKEGEGQVVDIVGEAGVGKSRLVYEFQKKIEDEVIFLTGNCVQYGRNINFLPVIDIVKGAFGVREGMNEEEVGHRIEAIATQDLVPMIPFYRNLLSLRVEDPKFRALEPEGRKFGTFEAVKDLLIFLGRRKPLVVCLEDVHWIDSISEALFTYFARSIAEQRILMLSAYRPEGAPSWTQGAHYQRLGIETLSSKSSAKLIRNVLHVPALEPGLEEKILEKTAGNPLFIEEIVRELLERGDLVKSGDQYVCKLSVEQCEIPNTVHGVLAARMDRLSEDLKRTMQVASVIGRDFAFRLLKTIMELGEELRSQMTNLVGLEILYEKALYPELEYIFKHALIQEVAYDSLLKQRRREIHGRTAQAIEELYADRLKEHYESLAHHYELSGDAGKAVKYLILAGEKSNQIGAAQAGFDFLKKASEISNKAKLQLDPETEVSLLIELASAQAAVGAIGDAVKGLKKAADISRRNDLHEYEKQSLRDLAMRMREWPVKAEAEQILEQASSRAREMNDKALESFIMGGTLARQLGEYGQRWKAYQKVVERERIGVELGDQRAALSGRLLRAVFERYLGRPQKTVELTEGALESALGVFNVTILGHVIVHRGIALAETGKIENSMAVMKNGIDVYEKFGVQYHLAALYNCLGYCYTELYQAEEAWEANVRSERIARNLFEKYPIGRRHWGHQIGHAETSLVETLFEQGELAEAWEKLKDFEKEAKGQGFDYNPYQWESRLNYLAAQILVQRNELDQAETLIQENLKKVRKDLMKKREGSFLRVLGEIQMKRDEHESAITTLNEAVTILKEVGNPRQLWQAHASIGSALDGLKRFAEAREHWGAAAEVIRDVASRLSDQVLREGFLAAAPVQRILSRAGR